MLQEEDHSNHEEESDDEGLMSSVGFMFDNLHAKEIQRLSINDDLIMAIKTIGDQPGHKQSGQYLWPAAKAAAKYLLHEWDSLPCRTEKVLELGAGCGLAGIGVSTISGVKQVVFTDYDMGTLSLIEDSVELNKTKVSTDLVTIVTSYLEWGKMSSSLTTSPPTIRSFQNDDSEEFRSFTPESRFPLIIGTDLIYCKDVVIPLFTTVKHFLSTNDIGSHFILVTSFALGEVSVVGSNYFPYMVAFMMFYYNLTGY
jgi:predicted nicotinamide N-methyase